MANWLSKYEQGGMVLKQKTKDNYGKQGNYNDAKVSTPPGYVGLGYNTKGRNYSPAWGGQFAMGGSIPGAVGFTYARVAGAAPSNGKYAKKTLASAKDGDKLSKNDNIPSTSSARNKLISDEIGKKAIAKKRIDAVQNTSQEFMQDWMNSPMYKQMLSNSAKSSEFEKINKERQQNLQKVIGDPNVFNIADLNEDNDYIDNLFGHRTLGNAGVAKTGNFKINLDKEVAGNKNLTKQIGVHEVSHLTDFNGNIPSSDIAKMQSYKKASDKAKSKISIPVIDDSEFTDYLAKPTETRARLNTLRYLGKEKGIYDPFTEKIDKTKLHKFNSIFSKDLSLRQLRKIYSDDQIVDMLNSVSKNDSNIVTPQAQNGTEMAFYQQGLDFTPKTISKNGSVIKDDMGQWAHPGEVTEINSNEITMKGVPYNVIGISDKGDIKDMKPGKDYKFKGSKVTEYPKGGWLNKYK
jgi:hypothetical protein